MFLHTHSGAQYFNALLGVLSFNLFQQNAQLCDCFQILSSARRFLNANQRRKINAFKANAESFYLEGMREDTDAQQREVSAGGGSERNVPEFRAL
jgi:hypothetical protein